MRTRLTQLLGIDVPIVQAPMAGSSGSSLAIAVAEAGGLGSLPCAMISADAIRREVDQIRRHTAGPFNLNFFCHTPPAPHPDRMARWEQRLSAYRAELGIEADAAPAGRSRSPFDESVCEIVEELRPAVVSFHFGLPNDALVDRVHATGAIILSSATSVAEALWLEARGCDVIIAQGVEAGGHRGIFLTADVSTQMGTIALVPQVVDAVTVPVIAAGGIADARGIAAALMLGASGVQIGTAYLLCPEAGTAELHRRALQDSTHRETALTNVFTGRPARSLVNRAMSELGPLSGEVPEFPLPAAALARLREAAESTGSVDFTPLWSGQAASLALAMPARDLTLALAAGAERCLAGAPPSEQSGSG